MLLRVCLLLGLASAFAAPAAACEPQQASGHAHSMAEKGANSCVTLDHVMAGDISISGAWARPMLPGQVAGSGFLKLENKGSAADRLVSISSEGAGKVEVHSMEMANDVMVMRPVDGGIEIAPGETVELKPGGMHMMFTDVAKPFAEGDSVTVTLTFEKAGAVDIELPVAKPGAAASGHEQHHTH